MEHYYSELVRRPIQLPSRHKLTRPERFKYLESLGFQTPLHGTVREVVKKLKQAWLLDLETRPKMAAGLLEVMVYRDHGRREFCSIERALEECPEDYCSEFMGAGEGRSTSHEYIQIGRRRWILEWESDDTHDSRNGATGCLLAELEPGYHPRIELPIFGIEFIPGDRLWAIDFEPRPEIEDTPIADVLKPEEFADLIAEAMAR